jgi:hypothetical protein
MCYVEPGDAAETVLAKLLADNDSPGSGADSDAAHDNFAQFAAGGDDAKRLSTIMTELTDMKNDAQQRTWSIYDDSDIIQEYLDEFLVLLEVCGGLVCFVCGFV